ncbi:precorrin-2 dehydrogenase/sirohydrochlorin ferrochelatase family protein [Marinicrinis sediminis]|uniref:precorrin-2 dehydrogenase n=1 Tax=Marinicrinis sediminis TaxID=1652465 RepID=A0ABW5R7D5_9BACL
MREQAAGFPVFLDLSGKRCTIVGAGKVAARRAQELLFYGAELVVIAPVCDPAFHQWATEGRLWLEERPYRKGDIEGSSLVVIATDQAELNREVAEDARASGIWVNAAHQAAEGDVRFPAVVQRGLLQLAVTTNGASPKLTQLISKRLSEQYGACYEPYVAWLHAFRERVKHQVQDAASKKELLARVVTEDILTRVENGEWPKVRQELEAELSRTVSLDRDTMEIGREEKGRVERDREGRGG